MSSIIKYNQIIEQGKIDLSTQLEIDLPLSEEYTSLEIKKDDFIQEEDHQLVSTELYQEKIDLEQEKKQYEEELIEKERQVQEEINQMLERANQEVIMRLEEAEAKAQTILEMANRESEQLVADAREQSKQIVQQAEDEKKSLLAEIEPTVVEIIKKIVERIVDVKMIGKADWLPMIVHKMIREENIAEAITIYLPEVLYTEHVDYLKKKLATYKHDYQIEVDYSLEEASCMVETSSGNLYYNIHQSIDEIFEELAMLQLED